MLRDSASASEVEGRGGAEGAISGAMGADAEWAVRWRRWWWVARVEMKLVHEAIAARSNAHAALPTGGSIASLTAAAMLSAKTKAAADRTVARREEQGASVAITAATHEATTASTVVCDHEYCESCARMPSARQPQVAASKRQAASDEHHATRAKAVASLDPGGAGGSSLPASSTASTEPSSIHFAGQRKLAKKLCFTT